jgi:dTMP kinase
VRGAFITLEGIEGVGKSTNVTFLQQSIEAAGHEVLATREPGGTPLGEQVREWVLTGEHGALSAEVETLLMFAARADHLHRVIRPALSRGCWVICDRFSDATLAYQGGGRGGDRQLIDCAIRSVHGDLMPDLTLLFDAPVEVGLARIGDRSPDHFERESRAFFERVRATYLGQAAQEPARITVIDAARTVSAVRADVERVVTELMERWS